MEPSGHLKIYPALEIPRVMGTNKIQRKLNTRTTLYHKYLIVTKTSYLHMSLWLWCFLWSSKYTL